MTMTSTETPSALLCSALQSSVVPFSSIVKLFFII